MPNLISSCDINMYADDTELHYCHSQLQRVEQVLQNEVERVSEVNRLKLNVTKSVCMLIGSCQRVAGKELCLSLHDSILKQVSSTKYLGVFIDQHLTWRSHIDYVLRIVRGKIYSINRLNPHSTVKTSLYQVYLLLIIDYCDVVWTPTIVNQTRHLEKFHSKFLSSCTTNSSLLKYSLIERRKFHSTMQVYKILHKLAPLYLHDMFAYATSITGCVRRNVHRLFVPQINTVYGRRNLFYHGTVIWNALPAALYNISSFAQFKCNYLRTF